MAPPRVAGLALHAPRGAPRSAPSAAQPSPPRHTCSRRSSVPPSRKLPPELRTGSGSPSTKAAFLCCVHGPRQTLAYPNRQIDGKRYSRFPIDSIPMGEHQRRRRRGSSENRAHQRAVLPLAPRLGAPARASPRRATSGSAASFLGTVDAALGCYLAPTLEHLCVSHITDQHGRDLRIPAGRIAPWLHFAAEHVVGELNLYLRVPQTFVGSTPEDVGEEAVLELLVCERAVQRTHAHQRSGWMAETS
ncbi:hypothetical protein C2845_PM15G00980 [Panicum miliaceum]|uniref:Uncharacterized protein n=1 Tax=Panicum miliaceum TaxID=4540 RepID=A0A3L6Q581_PANMI|nr:hypothetical protein C2845_PM15G00980 [Panicum miliaceum]